MKVIIKSFYSGQQDTFRRLVWSSRISQRFQGSCFRKKTENLLLWRPTFKTAKIFPHRYSIHLAIHVKDALNDISMVCLFLYPGVL